MPNPYLLAAMVLLLVIGVAALITLFVLYRRAKRAAAAADARTQKVARGARTLITTEHTILMLEEKIRDERHSPVPDLTMIRHWERELAAVKAGQREVVEATPWGQPK